MEVLVATLIEAMIVGALGMAFIGILNGTASVNQSLTRSGDARIAAAYIISDARNSSGPGVSLTDTTSCGSGTGATAVVRFNWMSTSSLGVTSTNIADYVLIGHSLLRRLCVNGTLINSSAVGTSVASVTVACLPIAACSGSPTGINVSITETADSNGAAYVYRLTGTFETAIGGGAPASPAAPQSVILLGTSGTCSGTTNTIDIEGGGTMHVYGDAFINTVNGASCSAMNLGNGGSFSAGATNILQDGSCTGTGCPTASAYSPAIKDPYSTLAAPPTTGLTSRTGCSGPGLYASGLNITSGTCTLTTGIYVVQNGFGVSNGASLNTGAGGVLIYLMSGAFTIGSANSVTLTAMTSGTFSGLAIWQIAADTQPITIGNGAITFVVNGAMYGPKAQLVIDGGVLPSITAIVVQTVAISNGITISVGSPSVPGLSINSASLPAWTLNKAYSSTLAAGGGDGNYTWSATGLPAGLSLNASTGVISGTPTAVGSSSVTIGLNDRLGDLPDSATFTLIINAVPTITTASPLPQAELTDASSTAVVVGGGTAPYSWSATGLPGGMGIGASSGVISGTPTATGTFTVAVSLGDAAGGVATKSLSLVVIAGPSITTASLPSIERTAPYPTTTLAASGGSGGYSWTQSGLPAGLSMTTAGVITGNPTAAVGSSSVVFTVTDSVGGSASKTLSLVITAQPAITSVALQNKSGGTAGKLEAGDKVTIVYGSTMKVSSFCNTWTTGDAANQTLSGTGLMVSIPNSGTTNDVLSITNGTGCVFNLGTIDLGSNAFVTANTTFGGTVNTTIAWTASTKTLVITLGTLAGTVGTTAVPATTPVYTPPAALVDSAGAQLGNSPFTVTPAAVRF